MIQNTISEPLSPGDLKAMDAAVTALELQFAELARLCKERRCEHDARTDADAPPTPLLVPQSNLVAINAAVDALEAQFDKMVRLSDEGRRRLPKLDEKSETFCRETLTLLEHQRGRLPPDFDLDSALDKLRTYDAWRRVNARVRRLSALFGA